MRALVKEASSILLKQVSPPAIDAPDEVLIRVMAAGICRSDIYAAQGLIKTADPIILGHEFSGLVAATGPAVTRCAPGDRVTVMPVIACQQCQQCRAAMPDVCTQSAMLGIDCNGAYCDFVIVPERAVYPLPDRLSFQAGAYIEPIAASLAVLKAGISPRQTGLIYGDNRIALLTKRVLEIHGFSQVTIYDARNGPEPLPECGYDFAIETVATGDTLKALVRAVRPAGKIVLKSRSYQPVAIDLIAAIKKEITFQAVNYGSFQAALDLVAEGRLSVSEMFGRCYPLERFKEAFESAQQSDHLKLFFTLAD